MRKKSSEENLHGLSEKHPTRCVVHFIYMYKLNKHSFIFSYLESLVHLLKGNIGSGLYAMGDAFKNGGLLFGSISIVFLGYLAIHCQHILVCIHVYRNKQKNILHNI